MISIGRRIFGIFFAIRHVCVVIHAEIGKKNYWVGTFSQVLNELEVRDFD